MTTPRPVNPDANHESPSIDALREAMIAELRDLTAIRTDAVEQAIRAVPRHLFTPEVPVDEAYLSCST